MEISPVSEPILPVQSSPITEPQTPPEPSESDPVAGGEEASGKARGVVRKLNEGGHFKGVSNVRLRISHFDNPDLEKIDPDSLPDPEDVQGKAYEKFLAQYRDLYNASLPLSEPEEPAVETPLVPEEPAVETPVPDPVPEEPVAETPPAPEEPAAETPVPDPIPEEPAVETPPVPEEPTVETPEPDPVPVIIEEPVAEVPLEIEPILPAPEQTEPEEPVDEGEGILAAFEELWTDLEEEPETIDIVM